MIKYIGSKRRLASVLGGIADRSGAQSALDLFTGTTRVAQAFKQQGLEVTAVDTARYARIFAECYIATDRRCVNVDDVQRAIEWLHALPPVDGYVTETFCRRSRFFTPENGARIDAMRTGIEERFVETPLYPILMTSLIEAADRVDSTTGLQMAYLKEWAPRALQPMALRVPDLIAGAGSAIQGDARAAATYGSFDLAYLDPPYNQHSYFGNYHIWETLVAWDAPEPYGVACKRDDVRDPRNKSPFNRKREMPEALRQTIESVCASTIVISYNDESWVHIEEIEGMLRTRAEHVETLSFDSKRYVGAQIGIHAPDGRKVGTVGRLRNLEYLVVGGPEATVRAISDPLRAPGGAMQPALFG